MNNDLVTVKPKAKIKGFDSDKISIIAVTKDDVQINHRINRLLSTPFYKDLPQNYKNIVDSMN